MKSEYLNLWNWIKIAAESQSDSIPWTDLPKPQDFPSPWIVWTLICLIRHRPRQYWLKDIIVNRLGADLELLSKHGWGGHPKNIPNPGVVPGLPDWEYYFHGCGCDLTHTQTGEQITVDFHGDDAEVIKPFFYITNYLKYLKNPPAPEQRLIQLHSDIDSIQAAFKELAQAGLLIPFEYQDYKLSPQAIEQTQIVENFCAAFEDKSRRVRLAALIGDWLTAQTLAKDSLDPQTASLIAQHADLVRQLRINSGHNSLRDLLDMNHPSLTQKLREALDHEDINIFTENAMNIVKELPNAIDFVSDIHSLFTRLDPLLANYYSSLWLNCIQFLYQHLENPNSLDIALQNAPHSVSGMATLLAMYKAPQLVLELSRKSLRSNFQHNRSVVAAVFSLINQPWSRQELLSILNESNNPLKTSECRMALESSSDPIARQAVSDWEQTHLTQDNAADYDDQQKFQLDNSRQEFETQVHAWREFVELLQKRDSLNH